MSPPGGIEFGTVLPHRSSQPLDVVAMGKVAKRAEDLGFKNLWVTENTLDHAYSLDPFVALTYAAAATRTIGLGVAVVVLPMHSPIHVAHQAVSLDHVSGGRMLLGVGLGRPNDYADFQVSMERRVRRFREGIELMKALWTEQEVTYEGQIYRLSGGGIALKPVQKPHPPLWLGGAHPNAIRRAARLGDGWIGGGAQTFDDFARSIPILQRALQEERRDSGAFVTSKRIFVAVDSDERVAERKLHQWFAEVYRKPELTASAGVSGTRDQVREKLDRFIRAGATHLLLNSVGEYAEQLEALAEVIALQ